MIYFSTCRIISGASLSVTSCLPLFKQPLSFQFIPKHTSKKHKLTMLLFCSFVQSWFYFTILFLLYWILFWIQLFSKRIIEHRFFFWFWFCQVVDSPYLINPEWRNFIPGYMYNDSDLALTAESFYRQSRLIVFMFLGDCVFRGSARVLIILHTSSTSAFAFTLDHKTEWIPLQDEAFSQLKRGKNLSMLQLSHFVQMFAPAPALGPASIMQLNIVFH